MIHDDPLFAEFCRVNAVELRENLERDGWDGIGTFVPFLTQDSRLDLP